MIFEKNKYYIWLSIIILVLIAVFFSFSPIITYDTGHYHSYLSILRGDAGWTEWDPARGIVFPLLTYVTHMLVGNSANGLLICLFCFYLAAFFCAVHLIVQSIELKKDLHKFILYAVIAVFIALDPLILGYYHTWLTEFAGATILVISSLLAFMLFKKSAEKYEKSSFAILIYFIVITPVAWHLKQPYVLSAVAPFVAAVILSLIRKVNKRNLLIQGITFVLVCVSLFVSLAIWGAILPKDSKYANQNRTSQDFLSGQIVSGLSDFKFLEFNPELVNSEFLSEEDVNKALSSSDENKKVYIVNIYGVSSQLKAQKLLLTEGIKGNMSESLKTWGWAAANDFGDVFDSYFNNWMGITNAFGAQLMDDPIGRNIVIDNKFSLVRENENGAIAYRISKISPDVSNVFYMPEELRANVYQYDQTAGASHLLNAYINRVKYKSNFLFTVMTLIMPFIMIGLFVKLIVVKKNNHADNAMFILSFSATMLIVLNVVLGAVIDRYLFAPYAASLIIVVLGVYRLAGFIKKALDAKKERLAPEEVVE